MIHYTTATKFGLYDRAGELTYPNLPVVGHNAISPDDKWIVYSKPNPGGGGYNIWVYDLKRQTDQRLTTSKFNDGIAVFSPDSSQIAFVSNRKGGTDRAIFVRPVNGSGQDELLVDSDAMKHHLAWSPDGAFLAWDGLNPESKYDIWLYPMKGAERKPRPFQNTQFSEAQPVFSPDGQWLAYISDETSRFEVYIQSVAGKPGKWRVSKDGGIQPRFNRNGKELVYLSADGKLVSVPIQIGRSQLEFGTPKELFQTDVTGDSTTTHYDMTSDGRSFLVPIKLRRETNGPPNPLKVMINWQSALPGRR